MERYQPGHSIAYVTLWMDINNKKIAIHSIVAVPLYLLAFENTADIKVVNTKVLLC